jgi:uncharacterized protein (TIGR00369 family)
MSKSPRKAILEHMGPAQAEPIKDKSKRPEKRRRLSNAVVHHCFGCSPANKAGLRLKFEADEQDRIVCHARIPRRFQGPPGYVHGGIIATLLDEAMSKANRHFGVLAMTRHIDVDYLKPVPLATPIVITSRHVGADGRKHHCEAEIAAADGTVLAKGRGLFIAIPPEYLTRD